MSRRRVAWGALAAAMLLLLLAAVACRPNLQPKVDKLEAQVSALQAEKAQLTQQNQKLRELVGPPPASLDKLFPPQAKAPVLLMEMFALSAPMEGIMVDLQEGDVEGAKANYQAFKAQYQKVSQLVPEWKDHFPAEPVEALGQALASGDPAKVGPAMGRVGQVCGTCHLIYQTKVHQKYHWGDFDEVKVTDPLSKKTLKFGDFMQAMGGAFSGIGNDLKQGQVENARRNYQAFKARFTALAQNACKQCHKDPTGKEIPRKYFVDESIKGLIDQLGKAISATPPDAKAVEQLSGAIGNESCMKCHLVHFPAAQAHERWESLDKLLK